MVGDVISVEKRGGIWGGLGLGQCAGSSKMSGGKGKFEGTFFLMERLVWEARIKLSFVQFQITFSFILCENNFL
jgi:hypothetical protein